MSAEAQEVINAMDLNELITIPWDVCCKWRGYHQDFQVHAVSEEHARKIAAVVFLDARNMEQDLATTLCMLRMDTLERLIPGLKVVAEPDCEGGDA